MVGSHLSAYLLYKLVQGTRPFCASIECTPVGSSVDGQDNASCLSQCLAPGAFQEPCFLGIVNV